MEGLYTSDAPESTLKCWKMAENFNFHIFEYICGVRTTFDGFYKLPLMSANLVTSINIAKIK